MLPRVTLRANNLCVANPMHPLQDPFPTVKASPAGLPRMVSGIKRAIACEFAPDGALYVLDFGQLETTDLAPNAIPRTGVLWRIVPQK